LDISLQMMNEWELDPHAIKEMLNTKNKALLCKEMADDWRLVDRGIISQYKYNRWITTIKRETTKKG
jgi:hypothetical protein